MLAAHLVRGVMVQGSEAWGRCARNPAGPGRLASRKLRVDHELIPLRGHFVGAGGGVDEEADRQAAADKLLGLAEKCLLDPEPSSRMSKAVWRRTGCPACP